MEKHFVNQKVGKGPHWMLTCLLLMMASVVCAEDFVSINQNGPNGVWQMFRQTDGQIVWTAEDTLSGISLMAVGPDGHVYAATSNNQDVRMFDGETGEYLGNPVNNVGHRLYDVCFGPDIDDDGIEDMYIFGGGGQGVKSFTSSSGYTEQGSWTATVTTGAWVGDFGPDVNGDGVLELYVIPELLQNSGNVMRVIDGANPDTELYTVAIPDVVRPGCLVAGSDDRIYITGRNNDVVVSYLPDGTDAQIVADIAAVNFPTQIAEGNPGQWYMSNRFNVTDLPSNAGSVTFTADNFETTEILIEGTVADDLFQCIASFDGGPPRGSAHSPVPTGNKVDSQTVTSVSWYSPEQDAEGVLVGDENIVSVDGYDVYWSTDPNYLIDDPVSVKQAEQSYTPPALDYNTTYYWRVDTHVTWNTDEITGNFTDIIEGPEWKFTTAPEYLAPTLNLDGVFTTLELIPATLAGEIAGNSDEITSVIFDLKEDDVAWPEGSDATITDTTTDNQNPTATLSTTVPGTYKVTLEISDGTTTLQAVASVEVYEDPCLAKKDSPSGWTANYYDRDGDCVVDLADFNMFALEWLDDTSMAVQEPYNDMQGYVPQAVYDVRIEAEDVDLEDPNACSDGPISDNNGIRIQDQPNASGGQATGYASDGAWIDYEIDVPAAGTYNVYAGYGLNSGTQEITLGTEAEPEAYGSITIQSTGNWAVFTMAKVGQVTFTASGTQTLRMTYKGGANLDWFSFDF